MPGDDEELTSKMDCTNMVDDDDNNPEDKDDHRNIWDHIKKEVRLLDQTDPSFADFPVFRRLYIFR
jgi:hypothetical protein